ncbi:MAG: hypothetical protein MUD14_05840 [Hydrococcus sp. Prado102]|jgi:hypothetical protein|nr:hypothetical protein [Hydrococcus sp. Prado102]
MKYKFYSLTPETGKRLREANLTAAEWRLWSYLVEKEPFGDRYQEFDTLTVIQECEISKTTLWRAMGKLQDLCLFDFQDRGIYFKNETGISKMKQEFQKRNGNFKNETEISEMKPEISKMKFSEPEISSQQEFQNVSDYQTIKTNKTLSEEDDKTFSEKNERENLNLTEEKKPEVEDSSELTAKKQESSQQLLEKQKDFELEQNSAAPLNKNLQKDGRFSPQYQKVLDALPDAKSYLEWAYKHCADGLPAYPTYPSRVIENNHHDLYSRYRQEQETRDAIARSTKTQAAKEKSSSETVFADPGTVKKLFWEAMKRV